MECRFVSDSRIYHEPGRPSSTCSELHLRSPGSLPSSLWFYDSALICESSLHAYNRDW